MGAQAAGQRVRRDDFRSRARRGEREEASRSSAIVVGLLYIVGTVAGVLSTVVVGDTLDEKYVLLRVPGREGQLLAAAFLVLTMGLSLAMIPVVMYPILRRSHQVLAMGYVVFRGALETATYMGAATCWLLLLPVSTSYAQAAAPKPANLRDLSATLLQGADMSGILTSIVFSLGALMFSYILFQSQLIPRWLAGWGLLAGILYLAGGLLELFDTVDASSGAAFALDAPMLVQEMVLAVWLILKGFAVDRSQAGPLLHAY